MYTGKYVILLNVFSVAEMAKFIIIADFVAEFSNLMYSMDFNHLGPAKIFIFCHALALV